MNIFIILIFKRLGGIGSSPWSISIDLRRKNARSLLSSSLLIPDFSNALTNTLPPFLPFGVIFQWGEVWNFAIKKVFFQFNAMFFPCVINKCGSPKKRFTTLVISFVHHVPANANRTLHSIFEIFLGIGFPIYWTLNWVAHTQIY